MNNLITFNEKVYKFFTTEGNLQVYESDVFVDLNNYNVYKLKRIINALTIEVDKVLVDEYAPEVFDQIE